MKKLILMCLLGLFIFIMPFIVFNNKVEAVVNTNDYNTLQNVITNFQNRGYTIYDYMWCYGDNTNQWIILFYDSNSSHYIANSNGSPVGNFTKYIFYYTGTSQYEVHDNTAYQPYFWGWNMIRYCSFDVYYQGSKVKSKTIFENEKDFYFDLQEDGRTDYSVFDTYGQFYSKFYSLNKIDDYHAYISLDDVTWNDFLIEDDVGANNNQFIFYYNIYENGNYHIKLYDDVSGTYLYDDYIQCNKFGFDVGFSTTESTDEPILVYTKDFPDDNVDVYNLDNYLLWYVDYINLDDEDSEWVSMVQEDVPSSESSNYTMRNTRYWSRLYKNGTYRFRFRKSYVGFNGNDIDFFVTKNVTNINRGDFLYGDFTDTPTITLDYDEESQSYVLRTQNILLDKALNLKCFITDDSSNDNITTWNEMEIGFKENEIMHSTECYFYYKIPVVRFTRY